MSESAEDFLARLRGQKPAGGSADDFLAKLRGGAKPAAAPAPATVPKTGTDFDTLTPEQQAALNEWFSQMPRAGVGNTAAVLPPDHDAKMAGLARQADLYHRRVGTKEEQEAARDESYNRAQQEWLEEAGPIGRAVGMLAPPRVEGSPDRMAAWALRSTGAPLALGGGPVGLGLLAGATVGPKPVRDAVAYPFQKLDEHVAQPLGELTGSEAVREAANIGGGYLAMRGIGALAGGAKSKIDDYRASRVQLDDPGLPQTAPTVEMLRKSTTAALGESGAPGASNLAGRSFVSGSEPYRAPAASLTPEAALNARPSSLAVGADGKVGFTPAAGKTRAPIGVASNSDKPLSKTTVSSPNRLTRNADGSLTDQYGRKVPEAESWFRETSPDGILDLARWARSGDSWSGWVTDTPELALGQGTNKGVKIKFDGNLTHGLETWKKGAKPGLDALKAREYEIVGNATNVANSISEIRIDKAAISDKRQARLFRTQTKRDLEALGFDVSDNGAEIVATRRAAQAAGSVVDPAAGATRGLPSSPALAPKMPWEMLPDEFVADAKARGQFKTERDWASVVNNQIKYANREVTPSVRAALEDSNARQVAKENRVKAEIEFERSPDDFYYHVAPKDASASIKANGLVPGSAPTVRGGGYEQHSKGRVFLTDKGGVGFWKERIEAHLAAQGRSPSVVVVRVPKKMLGDLPIDEIGTKDARASAFYSENHIPASALKRGLPKNPFASTASPPVPSVVPEIAPTPARKLPAPDIRYRSTLGTEEGFGPGTGPRFAPGEQPGIRAEATAPSVAGAVPETVPASSLTGTAEFSQAPRFVDAAFRPTQPVNQTAVAEGVAPTMGAGGAATAKPLPAPKIAADAMLKPPGGMSGGGYGAAGGTAGGGGAAPPPDFGVAPASGPAPKITTGAKITAQVRPLVESLSRLYGEGGKKLKEIADHFESRRSSLQGTFEVSESQAWKKVPFGERKWLAENLGNVVEGRVAPQTPAQAAYVAWWKSAHPQVRDIVVKSGSRVIDEFAPDGYREIGKMDNFFPHQWKPEIKDMVRAGDTEVIAKIAERNPGWTGAQIREYATTLHNKSMNPLNPGTELPRRLNMPPEYLDMTREAVLRYGEHALGSAALNEAAKFRDPVTGAPLNVGDKGAPQGDLGAALARISQDYGRAAADEALATFNRIGNMETRGPLTQAGVTAMNALGGAQAILKYTGVSTPVQQTSQAAMLIAKDPVSYAKGTADFLKNPRKAYREGRQAGAVQPIMEFQQTHGFQDSPSTRVAKAVSKVTNKAMVLVSTLDAAGRTVAYKAAQHYAPAVEARLRAGGADAKLAASELRNLRLTDAEIAHIQAGNPMSDLARAKVLQQFVRQTQGKATVGERIPVAAIPGVGAALSRGKNFNISQAMNTWEVVVDPIRAAPKSIKAYYPAARLLLASYVIGKAIGETKEALLGPDKDRPSEKQQEREGVAAVAREAADNLREAAFFGIVGDVALAAVPNASGNTRLGQAVERIFTPMDVRTVKELMDFLDKNDKTVDDLAQFLRRIGPGLAQWETVARLRTDPGFIRDRIKEQKGKPGVDMRRQLRERLQEAQTK